MRLRYLHLPSLPPLRHVTIVFGREQLLDRACAIRFVVGVNGTGKSRLLQAITEIFLNLEAQRLPPFPVTFAYDLGIGDDGRTLYLRHQGGAASAAVFVEFDEQLRDDDNVWTILDGWDGSESTAPFPIRSHYTGNDLPGSGTIGVYLPRIMLAYTSGVITSWLDVFRGRDISNSLDPDAEIERPTGWTNQAEIEEQLRSGQPNPRLLEVRDEYENRSIGIFVPPESIKLALCAVALHQAAIDFRVMMTDAAEAVFLQQIEDSLARGERMAGLRGILNEVEWLWPVSIGLRINMRAEQLNDRQRTDLRRLYQLRDDEGKFTDTMLVTSVIRDPAGGLGRLLTYDLRRPITVRPGEDQTTASSLIEAISGRQDATPFDLFQQLYVWQQEGLIDDVYITVRKRNVDDLLLYDWLSDGERVFLGRMALFHLLQDTGDALVMLDEPETHFNDIWKREIVSIIDTILGDQPNDVVISTHSSITLTDVSNDEIELLYKQDGQTVASRIVTPTFGADPSMLMVQVFGAPNSIGKRAVERLAALLERDWKPEQREELERYIRSVGSGYYRSELRTIWRELDASRD